MLLMPGHFAVEDHLHVNEITMDTWSSGGDGPASLQITTGGPSGGQIGFQSRRDVASGMIQAWAGKLFEFRSAPQP